MAVRGWLPGTDGGGAGGNATPRQPGLDRFGIAVNAEEITWWCLGSLVLLARNPSTCINLVRSSRLGMAWGNGALVEGCPQVKRAVTTLSGGYRSGSAGAYGSWRLSASMISRVRSWSSASRARSFFALSNKGWYSVSSAGDKRRGTGFPPASRGHPAS